METGARPLSVEGRTHTDATRDHTEPETIPSLLSKARRVSHRTPREEEMQRHTLTSLTPAPREGGWAVAAEGIPSDDTVPTVFTGVGLARI